MVQIVASFTTGTNEVAVAVSQGRGGGRWKHPGVFRVVSYPRGTRYVHARQIGVVVHLRRDINMRNRGPRSRYQSELAAMVDIARRIAMQREPVVGKLISVIAGCVQRADFNPVYRWTMTTEDKEMLRRACSTDGILTHQESKYICVLGQRAGLPRMHLQLLADEFERRAAEALSRQCKEIAKSSDLRIAEVSAL